MSSLSVFALCLFFSAAFAKLPGFHVNTSAISVSGISAGAFMAVQLDVAFSATFIGVGIIAGGPYYCAEGVESTALTACMSFPELLKVDPLVADTKQFAQDGKIDPVSNIARQKIYLYSGILDEIVHKKVVMAAESYFTAMGVSSSNIKAEFDIMSAHCQPTTSYGNPCAEFGSPYMNKCNYDGAGIALAQILGTLAPAGTANSSAILQFDQTAYIPSGNGMAASGYVYVPAACYGGAKCLVHVALHGCSMTYGDIQGDYIQNAGYNTWAESNNIIVLYPQMQQGSNNGCFDWWGYTNANYAFKTGVQMAAIMQMVADLSSA
jgi:poly(3-hydroxybutyrate) depolymerase